MKGSLLNEQIINKYKSLGFWDGTTILDDLEKNVKDFPDFEAIIDSNFRMTWADVDRVSDRLAVKLHELNIKRDQIVIMQLPNIAEHYLFVLAFRKAGIIGLCPPLTYRHLEMGHALKFLGAVCVITMGYYKDFNYLEMLEELATNIPSFKHILIINDNGTTKNTISIRKIMEEDYDPCKTKALLNTLKLGPWEVSQLLSTSGTTGVPKFVELAEAPLKCSGMGAIKQANASVNDVFGVLAPFTGAPGQLAWMAAPQIRAKCVLINTTNNDEILSLIEQEKITYLFCVPTQLIRLIKHPSLAKYNLDSLRVVRTGGAPLDKAAAIQTEEILKCKVIISGGSSEVRGFGYTTVNDPDSIRVSTLGKPPYGNRIMICDHNGNELKEDEVGELWVTGAEMSQGYFKNPEATKESFVEYNEEIWYRTGDNATINQDGNLVIMGRIKDMILRGGQNVFPKEIEDLLIEHPKIDQIAIVGMPDPEMGEKSCAYVITKSGLNLTLEEIISYLEEKKVAKFKFPERLEIVDNFPVVSDIQKVDKKALRKDIEQKLSRETMFQAI